MDPASIAALVSPVAVGRGLEVDRVEVMPAGQRRIVRIFLDGDGPEGRGPSLDEISDATRAISQLLDDVAELGSRRWVLEVSSRGVGRPLTELKHFRRNLGRLIKASGPDGELTGRIVAADAATVELDLAGTRRSYPVELIAPARVQIELNRSSDQIELNRSSDQEE